MVNSFHSLDQPYKVIKSFNDFGISWDCDNSDNRDFRGKAEHPWLA